MLIIEALLGLTGQVPTWPRSLCPGTGLKRETWAQAGRASRSAKAGWWCRRSCRCCCGVSAVPLSPLWCLRAHFWQEQNRSRWWLHPAKVSAPVFLPVLPGGLSAAWLHPSSIFSMVAGGIVCKALGCERHSTTARCLCSFAELCWFILPGS